MDRSFFDLRATHNPHRWFMPLTPDVCVGRSLEELFMFGGVGLASAISAMEQTTGRPLIWATAQYLSYAQPPSVVDLDVLVPVSGKYNSQARVIGHVGDKEILTVNAALGARPSEISQQWLTMPDVPRPEDCEPGEHWRQAGYGLHSRMEIRVARGRYGFDRAGAPEPEGRLLMWVRPRERYPIDAPMLAIIADHLPSGVGNALGKNAGGNSLDNTLRIRRIVPTEWVLCDIRILGVHGGFGHGAAYLFAQDGELMATASQSLIVRVRETLEDR